MIRDAAIVRVAREAKKMTQEAVAGAAKLSTETVRRMERADVKVSISNRAAIATAVGAQFDWNNGSVVAPKDIPEARIKWAQKMLEKRLAAIAASRPQKPIAPPQACNATPEKARPRRSELDES